MVYQIISYINQRGIIQLALGKTKMTSDSVGTFYNRAAATEKLEQLCELFKLCPRYCTLQSNIEVCSHYRIRNCEGICDGSELVQDYNEKVKAAIASLSSETQSYVIREKGRHFKEEAFVLIKEGRYQGFGFVEVNVQIAAVEDYEPFLKLQEATYHTNKILSNYLRKQGNPKILFF
jgi:DNA polymerase-3 subunit epsilon